MGNCFPESCVARDRPARLFSEKGRRKVMKQRDVLLALLVGIACIGVGGALWIGLDIFIGSQ